MTKLCKGNKTLFSVINSAKALIKIVVLKIWLKKLIKKKKIEKKSIIKI